ncbi:MAG: DUF5309 family protein [Sedimentisphaerales bacterium]|nr:DUF5309 family protein [Sedimentisphaerales bacterium]
MSFTGKATYTAGASFPELAEDVSDLVGIVSPYETPLLDLLGDAANPAVSTYHEWLEDSLLPNKDVISDSDLSNPSTTTEFDVANGSRFQIGDQIQVEGSKELMLVNLINFNTLTVLRGYGGTIAEDLENNTVVNILGNAALEGGDRPQSRFTNRIRQGNFTQIFTASVEVSGSDLAARQLGIANEMDYQKQERLRELLRDLENTVINGGQPIANPQGSGTVRRTLNGIIPHINSNVFKPGDEGFPVGTALDEEMLNYALRQIWQSSSGNVDLIVVNGFQKRRINSFISPSRAFGPADQKYTDLVSLYESDFGLCRVVLSRWAPQNTVLLLDSSRVTVVPLAGRSFHFKPLSSGGDYECGQLIGEYTLEMRNEEAHGCIRGLDTE